MPHSAFGNTGLSTPWTLATKVHRDPSGKGYGSIIDVKPNKTLVPLLLPALALKLADLPVD